MQGKKNLFSADFCILILIAVACVYMFCCATALSGEASLFPQVVSAVTFIVCIYAIGTHVVKAKAAVEEHSKEPKQYYHLILIGVALLYVLLLKPIGFIVCTIALFLLIPMILGNRNLKILIPVAVIASVAFYLVFKKCFYVNLPSGILPFF